MKGRGHAQNYDKGSKVMSAMGVHVQNYGRGSKVMSAIKEEGSCPKFQAEVTM